MRVGDLKAVFSPPNLHDKRGLGRWELYDLARDRTDQRPDRFAAGEKFDARVILFDKKARKVQVSIKALEMAEEKEAIEQFGSSDSGASLGDILGAALKKQKTDE